MSGQGVWPTELGVPVVGDREQVRVEGVAQLVDRLGERGCQVAVLAFAETVPRHRDGGAEGLVAVVELDQLAGVGRGEQIAGGGRSRVRPARLRRPTSRRHRLAAGTRMAQSPSAQSSVGLHVEQLVLDLGATEVGARAGRRSG